MIKTASRANATRTTAKRRLLRAAIAVAFATTATVVVTPTVSAYDGPNVELPPLPINVSNSVRTNPFCVSDSVQSDSAIALASGSQASTIRLRKVGNAIGLAPINGMVNQSVANRQDAAIQIDVPQATPIRKNHLLGSKHHSNFDLVPADVASPAGNDSAFRKLTPHNRMPSTPQSLTGSKDNFAAIGSPRPQSIRAQQTEMVLIPRLMVAPKPVVAEPSPAVQPAPVPAAETVVADVAVRNAAVAEVVSVPQPVELPEQQVSFSFSLSDDSESSSAIFEESANAAENTEVDHLASGPTDTRNVANEPLAEPNTGNSATEFSISSFESDRRVQMSAPVSDQLSGQHVQRQRVKRNAEINSRPSFVVAAAPIVALAEPDALSLADSEKSPESLPRAILPIESQQVEDARQPRVLSAARPVLLVERGPEPDVTRDKTDDLAGLMPPSTAGMTADEKANEFRPPVDVARAPLSTSNPSPADNLVGSQSHLTAVEMPVFDTQTSTLRNSAAADPQQEHIQTVSFDQRMQEIAQEYGIENIPAAATPLYMSRAQVKSLKIGGDLYRINVADGKVCNAISVNKNEIKVIGAGNGVTRLAVWAAPQGKSKIQARVFEIHVTDAGESASKPVDDHLSVLNRTVRHAFPYAEVEFQQTDGQLVVSGFCSNSDTATQIIRMVRKTYLQPVIDELTVR